MRRYRRIVSYVVLAGIGAGALSESLADEKLDDLLKLGKYEKAIRYAREQIPAAERDVGVWLQVAEAHEKIGSPRKDILGCYEEARKANPSDPRVYLGLARMSYRVKDYKKALEHYQKSYLLSRTAEASEGIALSALKLGKKDMARDAAESAVALDSSVHDSRLILADQYFNEGKYKEAAEQLRFIVRKKPKDIANWRRLAVCCEKTDNAAKLAEADKHIVDLDKKDIQSRQRLARYRLTHNDTAAAYKLYKELALLTPKEPEPFKMLYRIAEARGEEKDAVLYLKNFLVLDSTDASLHAALGNLLYGRKEFDGALDAYRKARTLDPRLKGFYRGYADIVLDRKLHDEAVEVITSAIKLGEATPRIRIALGDIYRSRKEYDKAIEMYEKALEKEGGNVAVLRSLGDSRAAAGQTAEAAQTFEQIVVLQPKGSKDYKRLGELRMKLGRKKEGIEAYRKYLTAEPSDERVARTIGLFEHENKRYDSAIKYLAMVKSDDLRDVEFFVAQGESYRAAGDCGKASEALAAARAKGASNEVLKRILKPLAQCYRKLGRESEAAEAYEAYTALPGIEDADASYLKAFLREKIDKAAAVKIYEANTKRFPRDPRNFLRLGILYSADPSKRPNAADALEKVVELEDTVAAAWEKLGEVYGHLDNEDKELAAYRRLLTLEPQHLAANKRAGVLLLKKGKTASAIANLEVALTSAPKDVEVLTGLAQGYMKTDRPGQAVDLLTKAKKLRPGDPAIRTDLIEAAEKAGRDERVAAEKGELATLDKKIVAADKKDAEARKRLAQFYIDKGDHAAAYPVLAELHKLQPDNKAVVKKQYETAQKLGKDREAIEHLKVYLERDPDNAGAHGRLGTLLYKQKAYDDALEAFRKAVELDPKITGIYDEYGEIVVSKGLKDEAVKVLNAAIASGEADTETYVTLGKIYREKKKFDDAIAMFGKALERKPKDVGLLRTLAGAQAAGGKIADAIVTYEQVVMLDSGAKEDYRKLGDLRTREGKEADAIKVYKKYVKRVPSAAGTARKIGLHEYAAGNYKEALTYLKMVKDAELHSVQYLEALGMSYYHTGDYGNAAQSLALVRKKNASTTVLKKVLVPLGKSYEKSSKPLQAADAYDAYVGLKGVKDADAAYKRARLREKTDKAKAVELYERNTRGFPGDYRNFLRLGLIYAGKQENLSRAAQRLTSASRLIDTMAVVWEKLGEVQGKLGNKEGELAAYEKLLSTNQQHLAANKRVGALLLEKGETSRAITNLEMALTMKKDDVETMLLLARGYLDTKRPAQAIELLERARETKKTDPDLLAKLYELYKETGNKQKAEAAVKKLISLTGKNEYRLAYAEDLVEQKRLDEAQKVIKEIIVADHEHVDALMLMAMTQRMQNKLNEAVETYKSVTYVDDTFPSAYRERAEVYLKLKQLDRAGKYFQKAVELDPKRAGAYLGLARVAEAGGKKAEYEKYLQKAKQLNPNHPDIKAELAREKK